MPIGFLLGQLSRDRVDPNGDAITFEATVKRLRSHLLQEGFLTDLVCLRMTAVEKEAKRLLRIRFERSLTADELEGLHSAVDGLRHALFERDYRPAS